jgi:hypothetical protein
MACFAAPSLHDGIGSGSDYETAEHVFLNNIHRMKVSFCPLVGGERIREEKRVIGSFIFSPSAATDFMKSTIG